MEKLLSVILPVYNVEKYIRASVESIFHQGMDDECFEVIIVNDGTPDNSIEIVKDIVSEHKNVIVLNQTNQGLAMARNNGISVAKGKYIIMPDSDDIILENSLKLILDVAIKTNVDIVVADFLQMTNDEISKVSDWGPFQRNEPLELKEMSGPKLFLDYMHFSNASIWHMLYRKDFLLKNGLRFIPGLFFEDLPFTPDCFLKAGKCIKINKILNIYRRCPESLTMSRFNKIKAYSLCTCVKKVWELKSEINNDPLLDNKLKNYSFELFSVLICFISHSTMGWHERGKIVSNLRNDVVGLYFMNGIKQKVVSFLFWRIPHIYIYLCVVYMPLYLKTIYSHFFVG